MEQKKAEQDGIEKGGAGWNRERRSRMEHLALLPLTAVPAASAARRGGARGGRVGGRVAVLVKRPTGTPEVILQWSQPGKLISASEDTFKARNHSAHNSRALQSRLLLSRSH